jgi:hypothetical protein
LITSGTLRAKTGSDALVGIGWNSYDFSHRLDILKVVDGRINYMPYRLMVLKVIDWSSSYLKWNGDSILEPLTTIATITVGRIILSERA